MVMLDKRPISVSFACFRASPIVACRVRAIAHSHGGLVDNSQRITVPRIFVAGDLVCGRPAAIIVAASAGIGCDRDLAVLVAARPSRIRSFCAGSGWTLDQIGRLIRLDA